MGNFLKLFFDAETGIYCYSDTLRFYFWILNCSKFRVQGQTKLGIKRERQPRLRFPSVIFMTLDRREIGSRDNYSLQLQFVITTQFTLTVTVVFISVAQNVQVQK